MRPFQIVFTPVASAELSRMPKDLQLHILGEFRGLPQEVMHTDLERFGKLQRAGRELHRFRLGDYRVYFERHDLGLLVHRILGRNTLKDFRFRSNLPMNDEDEALEADPKFWQLIESSRG
jgi:mRNA-degrading endonuclease RelE of RelBE toxin-antitoxin system